MNPSPRTLAILADIAPALDATRRTDGYYPPAVAVRDMIAARHGDTAANTLYHNHLIELIQRHVAPLYSGRGARQFAAVGRKQGLNPLQGFDWFGAHPSPFHTALDWLYWRLDRAAVGDVVRVRSDLRIVRSDESAFKVYYGAAGRNMTVTGTDYSQAAARLLAVLLYGGNLTQVRNQHKTAQVGSLAAV